jgi:hypothetical protein
MLSSRNLIKSHQSLTIHFLSSLFLFAFLHFVKNNLDMAHSGLESETRRAARLREDQSVWRLQLIVAGLFVLLILLIFLGLSP